MNMGKNTEFNQKEYIKNYQKQNYKMYAFRVRKDNFELINKLDSLKNKNEFIINSLNNSSNTGTLSIKQIRDIIVPILNKNNIYEIYLFGSYARGEARSNSDVDIYCEKGSIKSLYDAASLNEELKQALKKEVDIVYTSSKLGHYFEENMKKDLIKLC